MESNISSTSECLTDCLSAFMLKLLLCKPQLKDVDLSLIQWILVTCLFAVLSFAADAFFQGYKFCGLYIQELRNRKRSSITWDW